MARRRLAARAVLLLLLASLSLETDATSARQQRAKERSKRAKEKAAREEIDDTGSEREAKFKEMYETAALATHHGDLPQAATLYEHCIGLFGKIGEIRPQNGGNGLHVHLYNQLAEVRLADGHLDEAEYMYNNAVTLALALKKQQKKQPGTQKDEESDEEDKEADIESKKTKGQEETLHRELMRAYRSIATIQLQVDTEQERLEDAILTFKAMRKHARSEHEEADIFKEIGILYLRQGNLNAAVQALEEAVDLYPEVKKGYSNLAIAYARQLNHKKAMENFELAIDVEPESPSLHTNYGITLAQIQDFTHARMALLEALRLDPTYQLAKDNLAKVEEFIEDMVGDRGSGALPRHKPLSKRYIGPTVRV
uniref:Uncharacterized protein n=1 Tax=Pyramimonas obovata TaxID=1411642 RepID=A0A7S0R1L3_9CHLO|mmetsp:Transcript_2318/g.4688  ORF Transcript_2318/g.4688 Transcript_2318/m.4688 type:complete len:368 (+) Transcript_2318:40-1143(+)|eukprot:CAMPEP_0118928254 /NCGR_PEP_ID=MMETSP1169-20130426/5545_1 /TAXON_ID=36882 /ORGANISM="Pyramimonas obovata, Strain CCMP722" /LENGTH=367 /DNA_ID=CAMNT_0006870179 /DNA_START=31 /DNA_END=1134 /DNA_ORIENTATION=-